VIECLLRSSAARSAARELRASIRGGAPPRRAAMEWLVTWVVVELVDTQGVWHGSEAALAAACGVSSRTVRRVLAELRRAGWVRVDGSPKRMTVHVGWRPVA